MIPKKIHFCWLSGDPYPPAIEKYINGWKTILPDYETVLWDTNRFDVTSVPWVQEAYEAKKYAFAADYIRLYAVYTEGGIYLDSDVEVLRSFDPLLHHTSFMGYEYCGKVEPAIIGSEAGVPWLKASLDYYQERHFISGKGEMDILPLPSILQPILERLYPSMPQTPPTQPLALDNGELILYPADRFCPDLLKLQITTDTYTIHHYANSWVTGKEKMKKRIFNFIARHSFLSTVYAKFKR